MKRLKLQLTGMGGVEKLDAILGVRRVGGGIVIVAVDPGFHLPVRGRSNNVQIPEHLVIQTSQQQARLSHTKKSNGETLTAFPDFDLSNYLLATKGLASVPAPSAPAPGASPGAAPVVHAGVGGYRVGKTRASDPVFSNGVKQNYNWKCAACGLSGPLLQSAHLIPFRVSQDNNTANGVCLCPNHHAAFDADIVTFGEDRVIYVNSEEIESIKTQWPGETLQDVLDPLRDMLVPSPIAQEPYLKQRFKMDTREGKWLPISDYRKGT